MRALTTPSHITPGPPFSDVVRVLVADDFPLVREANAAALRRRREIEVVGSAADGEEALEMARALRPDVAVLDLRMPNVSGLVALTQLTAELPYTRVLVLTASEEPQTLVDAISAGAAGFVTKRVTGDELADAVVRVSRGEPVFSPSLTPSPATLTTTERDVLRRLADGQTDRQIGLHLYMSTRTVQNHLSRIRSTLGLQRRAELARWAAEHLIM